MTPQFKLYAICIILFCIYYIVYFKHIKVFTKTIVLDSVHKVCTGQPHFRNCGRSAFGLAVDSTQPLRHTFEYSPRTFIPVNSTLFTKLIHRIKLNRFFSSAFIHTFKCIALLSTFSSTVDPSNMLCSRLQLGSRLSGFLGSTPRFIACVTLISQCVTWPEYVL